MKLSLKRFNNFPTIIWNPVFHRKHRKNVNFVNAEIWLHLDASDGFVRSMPVLFLSYRHFLEIFSTFLISSSLRDFVSDQFFHVLLLR